MRAISRSQFASVLLHTLSFGRVHRRAVEYVPTQRPAIRASSIVRHSYLELVYTAHDSGAYVLSKERCVAMTTANLRTMLMGAGELA